MKWKNIKLKSKFYLSFTLVSLLLSVAIVWGYFGISGLVKDANALITGNTLKNELNSRYVQHLQWAQNLSKTLTNHEVTKVSVQKDHTLCGFGQWYYGEGKAEALKHFPQLSDVLAEMEEPHKHLHETAKNIDEVFEPVDISLSTDLQERKIEHMQWVSQLQKHLVKGSSNIPVEKNPNSCKFGMWMNDQISNHEADPFLRAELEKLKKPHEELHESVNVIEGYMRENNKNAANAYFTGKVEPLLIEINTGINHIVAENDSRIKNYNAAHDIYTNKTLPLLEDLGHKFTRAVEITNQYGLTDEHLLSEAENNQRAMLLIIFISLIVIVGIIYYVTRSILLPVNKSIGFAREIAEGKLYTTIDVEQEDECGMLVKALKNMQQQLTSIVESVKAGSSQVETASIELSTSSQEVSQRASEQSSVTEELSSSVEEMVSSLRQNSDHAQVTEKIVTGVNDNVKQTSARSAQTADSMKLVAEKISIINEIAFQTNILALNAAVEAARAGEYGRGFAVVAAEVRKLAERSKTAANEINEVSKGAVSNASQAVEALTNLLPDIEKSMKLVQEIAASSQEQLVNSEQINQAIMQLNDVTQQNAASSEEMATSSEELSSQASALNDAMAFFKLSKNEKHTGSLLNYKPSERKPLKKLEFKKQEKLQNDKTEVF